MFSSSKLEHIPPRLRSLLEESILPSPHSVELEQTPGSDYFDRYAQKRPHIAELYHENSKLHPHTTMQPSGDATSLDELRSWFFNTAYDLDADTFLKHESPLLRIRVEDLPAPLSALLAPFSEEGPTTNLLYATDLLILHDGLLTRRVPESPFLWTEREVSAPELAHLGTQLMPDAEAWKQTDAVLFMIACPWRYMFLFGPRGYRHTLLDLGRLLAHVERSAPGYDITLNVLQNFHDAALDRFLLADGVERSVYAVVPLSYSPPHTE
jgi:hypothetical protein